MSDYTPTTEEMRERYVRHDWCGSQSRAQYEAEFDRWLEAYSEGTRADERERIGRAIEGAAYTLTSHDAGAVALSIKRQAARIARSGGDA